MDTNLRRQAAQVASLKDKHEQEVLGRLRELRAHIPALKAAWDAALEERAELVRAAFEAGIGSYTIEDAAGLGPTSVNAIKRGRRAAK